MRQECIYYINWYTQQLNTAVCSGYINNLFRGSMCQIGADERTINPEIWSLISLFTSDVLILNIVTKINVGYKFPENTVEIILTKRLCKGKVGKKQRKISK